VRNKKQSNGIESFEISVDFYDSPIVQTLLQQFGIKGEAVLNRICGMLYKNGYYLSWDKSIARLFIKNVAEYGIGDALVDDVVDRLLTCGFFDETMYNEFSILTSEDIQHYYFSKCKQLKRFSSKRKDVSIIDEFLLIDISEYLTKKTSKSFPETFRNFPENFGKFPESSAQAEKVPNLGVLRVTNNTQKPIDKIDNKYNARNISYQSNQSYLSINPLERAAAKSEYERYRAVVYENISYNTLCANNKHEQARIDEVVSIMLDVICTSSETVRVSKGDKPTSVVKAQYLKLNDSHIEYVLKRIDESAKEIGNIKSYIQTCLYNAPMTIDNYYANKNY